MGDPISCYISMNGDANFSGEHLQQFFITFGELRLPHHCRVPWQFGPVFFQVAQPNEEVLDPRSWNRKYHFFVSSHGKISIAPTGHGDLVLTADDGGRYGIDTGRVTGKMAWQVVTVHVFPAQEQKT